MDDLLLKADDGGFLTSAVFAARIDIGTQVLTSDRVTLHVKAGE